MGRVDDRSAVLVTGNGGVNDVFFGHLIADKHRDRLPLIHDEDAVAKTEQLDRVGGDQEDRRAGRGQLAHQPVDLLLGADVDATRRLRKQVDFGRQRQPLGDRDFLLVAAAQPDERLARRAQPDAQLVDQPIHETPLPLPIEETEAVEPIEAGQGEVLTGRELDDQAIGLAVLGNVGNPALHRRTGTAHRDRLIAEQDLSLNRMDAEEGGEELPLPLALQAAQAEDLAAMEIEADIMKALAGAEIADREDDRRRKHLSDWRLRREDILHLPADHELHQIVRRRARRGHGGDVLAVLEDRDAVGDREDLFQTVGDEDDRRAVVA